MSEGTPGRGPDADTRTDAGAGQGGANGRQTPQPVRYGPRHNAGPAGHQRGRTAPTAPTTSNGSRAPRRSHRSRRLLAPAVPRAPPATTPERPTGANGAEHQRLPLRRRTAPKNLNRPGQDITDPAIRHRRRRPPFSSTRPTRPRLRARRTRPPGAPEQDRVVADARTAAAARNASVARGRDAGPSTTSRNAPEASDPAVLPEVAKAAVADDTWPSTPGPSRPSRPGGTPRRRQGARTKRRSEPPRHHAGRVRQRTRPPPPPPAERTTGLRGLFGGLRITVLPRSEAPRRGLHGPGAGRDRLGSDDRRRRAGNAVGADRRAGHERGRGHDGHDAEGAPAHLARPPRPAAEGTQAPAGRRAGQRTGRADRRRRRGRRRHRRGGLRRAGDQGHPGRPDHGAAAGPSRVASPRRRPSRARRTPSSSPRWTPAASARTPGRRRDGPAAETAKPKVGIARRTRKARLRLSGSTPGR